MEEKKLEVVKKDDNFLMTQIGQEVQKFELLQREAKMYNSSTLVPKEYRGQSNFGNTVIALDMAKRMRANPLMVMQNLYVVHGKPAWSSAFLIATVNQSGKFTPIDYEHRGVEGTDERATRAYAYGLSDVEKKRPLYGEWVSIKLAKSEGWYDRDNSKWKTMPGQMLRYRSAAFWVRVFAPEISMGLQTIEEVKDTQIEDAEYEEVTNIGFGSEEPKQPEEEEKKAPIKEEEKAPTKESLFE